jgi:uridine kinase
VNRTDLVHELAAIIVGKALPHPTRVAIDGVDAAGKTTLANEIAAVLAPGSRQVIRASIDGFHNPKHIRRRDDSGTGYFRDSFNYQALCDNLLTPLGPHGSRQFRRAAFDFRTDTEVVSGRETAAHDAILILDGVFLLRTELRTHWDLSIFVQADFETSLARAQDRDRELFGDADAVRQRYEARYVPGQRLYLEQEQPRHVADFIVFSNDFNDPRLERAARPGPRQERTSATLRVRSGRQPTDYR